MVIHNAILTGSISMQAPPVISGSLTLTGSINATGPITGSSFRTTGTITAQTLVVQIVSSSIDFVTGSTKTGTLSSNTHQFTGSLYITGSVGIDAASSFRFNGVGDTSHAVGYDSTVDGAFLRGQNGVRFITGTGGGTERMRISAAGTASFTANALASAGDAATITLKQNSTTATSGIYLERSGEQKGYYIYVGGSVDSLTFQRNNAGTKGDVMALTRDGIVCIGGTSQLGSTTLSVFGSIAARNAGVDATYAEAFVAYYSANNTESNAILTSVSSAAGQSGFRFEVSNGAGSAARTNVLTLNRNSATFRGSDIRFYDPSSNINAGYELLWASNNGGTDLTYASIQGLTTSAGNRTGDILFKTGNAGAPTEKLRIQSDGKIGITTAGSNTYGWIYSIDVNHSIIIRGDRGGTASNYTNYYQYGGTIAAGLGHKFWTGGDLANQTLKLQVADNGIYMSSLGTGTVSATSGILSTSSDASYKTDAGFIENALDKVMTLVPRYFYWNEKSNLPNDIRQLGFYAQEVNEALGEEAANTPRSEDIPWGITDRSLIAFLTKAIQELKAEFDEYKTTHP